jgi:hypothetical protein
MRNLFPNLTKTKTKLLFFALTCAFVLNGNAQCDVTNGLIEQWKFDGSMANSISSNTAVGTGTGYYEDRFAVNPGAYVTNAYTQTLRATTTVNPGSNNTICFWFKRNGAVNGTWGGFGFPNSNGDAAIVCNNNNYGLNISGSGLTYGTAPATLNQWHFLAVVRAGTTGTLYYDGVQVLTGTLVTNSPIYYLSGFVGTVGGNYWAQSVPGLYDDYRIYNRALSGTEVLQVYNATVAASNPPIPPTITLEPQSFTVCQQQTVSFATLVTGQGITYQWQKNGVDIPGANNDTLTLVNAGAADVGTYRLIATNSCGADTSANATLTQITSEAISSGTLYIPVFTEYNMGNFKDYSGNGLDATFTYNGMDVDAQGTTGASVILNGTQNGQVAHNTLLNFTNQLTVSCWFNANNIATSQRLLDKTPANNGNNFLLDLLSSKPRFIVAGGSHTTTTTLTSATWYHVAATYNGSQVKIYVNGQLAYTGAQTGNLTANTLPLMIGSDQGGTNKFTGRIDEIRIYNTALNDLEIYGLYSGPKIHANPTNKVVCAGSQASFTVQGSGTGYTYQWKKNGNNIAGANTATYTVSNISAADTGSYTCALTRNCFTITSGVAKLNFPTPFNATTNLTQYWPFDNSSNANAVGGIYFNINSNGFEPDRFGNANNALSIPSQFNTFSLNNVIGAGTKSISLWYKYSGTSNTSRALLYCNVSGGTLLYVANGLVGVNNTQTTNYSLTTNQWYHMVMTFNGTTGNLYINGELVTPITGIPNNTISMIGNNNTAQMAAVGVLDDIRVYSTELTQANAFSLYNAPGITSQPQSQSVCAGQNTTFTVAASGTATYQWKKDGNILPAATSATLNITGATANDAGNYTCDISDACSGSTITSAVAALTVTGNVAITQQPSATNPSPVCGSGTTLTIAATDATSYQWRKDGVDIQGATGTTIAFATTNLSTSGVYDCIVGGCSANLTSNTITIAVQPATVPTGLLHHWKLNNGFTDEIAGNTLVPSGAVNYANGRFGNGNGAVICNAPDGVMALSTPVVKDTITIALWYYHAVTTGYKTIIGDTAGRYGDILTVINNEMKWQKPGSGAQATGVQLSTGWHHIAVTKQSTELKYYLDGTLAYTATNPGAVPVMGVAGNGGTQINRFGNTAPIYNNQPSKGQLDDIRIYNSVLNASQIAALVSEPEIYSIGTFSAACIGGSSSVTVNAGSSPTTQYQWQKNGTNIPGATSATLTLNNIQAGDAGNYTCIVSSSSGCVAATSPAAVLTPGAGNVSITQQPQAQTKCVGQAASFAVTTSGAAVTYQWKKDGNTLAGQTAATLNIAAVTTNDAGNYTCEISGGSCGLIATSAAQLTVNTPAVVTIAPATATICNGTSVTLTASGSSTYNWSNSGGSNATASYSPTTTTTYTVTATDANNCSATASKVVTVNALPSAAINGSSAVCAGSSVNLTATGGTAYAWSNSLGNTATVSVSPSTATTYTVTVTDANNCSATASKPIAVNQLPAASVSAQPATICSGQSTTLTANGGNTYAWNNGLPAGATQQVSPASTTTYNVTVTNTTTGCTATATTGVTVNTLPAAAITGNNSICPGTSVTLTATGGNSYTWSDNGGNNAAATFSPSATTSYTVTVTNANNCSATATQAVTVVPVSAAINGPSAICSGLSATLTASGGSSYAWSNNETTASITVTPTSASTYTVTATLSGCTATASQTVSVQTTPVASISGPTTVCAGQSVSLTANGGNTYAWSDNLGSNAIVSVSPAVSTTYTVTASLGANCSASASYTVDVLQPTSSSFSQTICNGESVNFDGNTITTSGVYTRTIPNSVGCDSVITLNLTVLSPIVTNTSHIICAGDSYDFNGETLTVAGTYYDTLTSVQSCDSVIMLELTIGTPTNITTQPVASTTICSGTDFSLDVTADGSNLTYEWIKDGTVIGSSAISNYAVGISAVADAGTYKVAVTGTCGVDTSDEALVVVNATPAPVVQQNGALLTSSVTGASYAWYINSNSISGANQQSYTATQTGNYKVEVTSADGCTGTSAEVNVVISGIETIGTIAISVYPNPATDVLMIQSDANLLSLEVFDIAGKKLLIENTHTNHININRLAQGTYVLAITTNNGIVRKPFIKN